MRWLDDVLFIGFGFLFIMKVMINKFNFLSIA